MVRSLIRYLRGYIRISFSCSNPDSFLNAIRSTGEIWDIRKVDSRRMSFTCTGNAFKIVQSLSQKWGFEPEVLYEKGLIYTLKKHKHRSGLLVGILFGLILLQLSTSFVWEVRVEGNKELPSGEIIDVLDYLGFGEGSFIPNVNFDRLNNSFLLTEKRISWISVNIKGTVAHVEVKERDFAPDRIDKQKCVNIIAARDGIIERVDAHNGGKEVKKGDAVVKGQLLISSFMETRKSGTILRSAAGNVWAKTLRTFDEKIPLTYYEKAMTKNKAKFYSARILGKTLTLHLDTKPSYKKYEKKITEKNIILLGKIVLPIKVKCETYSEYELKKSNRSEAEAKELAMADLYRKIEEELTTADVLSREITEKTENGMYCLTCEIECIEDIAKEKTFYFQEKS